MITLGSDTGVLAGYIFKDLAAALLVKECTAPTCQFGSPGAYTAH